MHHTGDRLTWLPWLEVLRHAEAGAVAQGAVTPAGVRHLALRLAQERHKAIQVGDRPMWPTWLNSMRRGFHPTGRLFASWCDCRSKICTNPRLGDPHVGLRVVGKGKEEKYCCGRERPGIH